MYICPKCKGEYIEGIEFCSDCGIKLVNENKSTNKEIDNKIDDNNFLFLANVADGYELNIIEALLESNDIIYLKKHREGGEYLKIGMGMTTYGIDIYVDESQISEAKEILEYIDDNKIDNKLSDEDILDQKDYDKKRRIRMWMILGVSFISTILAIIFSLISKF